MDLPLSILDSRFRGNDNNETLQSLKNTLLQGEFLRGWVRLNPKILEFCLLCIKNSFKTEKK